MSTGEPLDLDAIRREVEMYTRTDWSQGSRKVSIAVSLAEGVPALLSEVEDLRSANEWLRGAADALSAERDRLRDELSRALVKLHKLRGES
jgi:hypothetical protein